MLWAAGARADAVYEPGEPLPHAPLPRGSWFTLQTPHFNIHFYRDEAEFAERVAHFAERAYRLNTRYLNWRPSGRVTVVLSDVSDQANGSASSIPYTFINAYGAPPDSLDELNDFDDYMKLLITHELTHVVHLDTMLSICSAGDQHPPRPDLRPQPGPADLVHRRDGGPHGVAPDHRRPPAQQLLRHAPAGRLSRRPDVPHRSRSPSIPNAYPQGTAAYLYGASLLRYIEDRYGPHKIREISQRYADTCIPGGINRTAEKAVGSGYVGIFGPGLWDDWRRAIAHRYALQAEDAKLRPLTAATRLTWEAPAPRSEGPGAAVPAGRHAGLSPQQQRSVAGLCPPRSRDRRAAPASPTMLGGGPAAPTPDGQALIFQRVNYLPLPLRIVTNSTTSPGTISSVSTRERNGPPAHERLRAHEPDVSPDGRQIACVLAGTGIRQLALVPIEGGAPARSCRARLASLSPPPSRPTADSSPTRAGSRAGSATFTSTISPTATDRALAVDRAMDIDPRFSPDGRYVLFSSDRSGINDIYAYELATQRLYQVTNVLSGAFQPTVSPDGHRLVFTGFTTDGFDLWTMPYDPAHLPAGQAVCQRATRQPRRSRRRDRFARRRARGRRRRPVRPARQPLRPLEVHVPAPVDRRLAGRPVRARADVPAPDRGRRSGQLPFLLVQPAFSHQRQPLRGASAIPMLRFWPAFNLSVTKLDAVTNGLIIDNRNLDYLQRTVVFSASTDLPVLQTPDASADISFGYDYALYGPISRIPVGEPTGGITVLPQTGPAADLNFVWSFSNAHRWQYSISNQEGRSFNVNLRLSTRGWAEGSTRRASRRPGPNTSPRPGRGCTRWRSSDKGGSRWATSGSSSRWAATRPGRPAQRPAQAAVLRLPARLPGQRRVG